MIPKIRIRDLNLFSEAHPSRRGTFFEWEWDRNKIDTDITVFTDRFLDEALSCNSTHKIAWLLEPPAIDPGIYEKAASLSHVFDVIYTYDQGLIERVNNAHYCAYGSAWVHDPDWKIYDKSKMVSMIVSVKNYTPGQRYRMEVYNAIRDRVDVMGKGIREIEKKVEGLHEYRFSIAMENSRTRYYFTEKLMDCFASGTVPIYWGCPGIDRFFDPAGIILFDSIEELKGILDNLSVEEYEKRAKAIKNNYEIALTYRRIEDNLWFSGLKSFIEKRHDRQQNRENT